MFQVRRAPTVTGQSRDDVTNPAFAAASQRVSTWMSSAYQYQPSRFLPRGSNVLLATMPWRAGETPVTIVVWLTYVTVGITPVTAAAYAPSRTSARRLA